MTDVPERDRQTFAIIGAAMEVHRHLGHGFLESVYRDALCREFWARAIPFQLEVALPVIFKGERLAVGFRADLVCDKEVIVELKALRSIGGSEEAQLINYLKASGLSRGLLLNFGARSLAYRRLVLSRNNLLE